MRALAAALAFGVAGGAAAHHAAAEPAARPPAPPFPVEIRADFDLVDQTGARRRAADFLGRPMLVFFGYATCEAICSVALPRMAETLDLLGDRGAAIAPVLITIDPERDTPAALAEALPEVDARLIGLTGSEAALAEARAAFQIEVEKLFEAPDGAPVFAHGSFIYLVGPDGEVATLLPPILGPDRMAEIVATYL